MRPTLPDGWPGLVGIAVLVGGSALALGTPRLSEVGGFPSADASFFTDERGPDLGLAIAGVSALNQEADAAAVALGDDGFAERSLSIVGTFDTNADAVRAADSESPSRRRRGSWSLTASWLRITSFPTLGTTRSRPRRSSRTSVPTFSSRATGSATARSSPTSPAARRITMPRRRSPPRSPTIRLPTRTPALHGSVLR